MRTPVARRLLDQMLVGEELEEHDVRELVAVSGETLYVDFKHGDELDDSKKAAKTVRQYAAGFANADGGILVIGVSDGGGEPANRRFTKTTRPGGQPLDEWARNSLASLAGYLSPAPRIQVVTVDGVEVLLVGIARAPALVPCVESGELKYYLRIGDSTPAIPPYLISDLILGRREHPRLQIHIRETGPATADKSEVTFAFDLENESMVPAKDVTVGVICWGRSKQGSAARSVPNALRTFIDAIAPNEKSAGQNMLLVHATSRKPDRSLDLPGFGTCRVASIGDFLVPRPEQPVPVRAALYAMASGHPPEWYQLDWLLPASGETTIRVANVDRVGNERPVVAWNQEWRNNPAETTKE